MEASWRQWPKRFRSLKQDKIQEYIDGKALPLRFRVRLKDKKIHYLEPAHIYSSYSGGDGSASNPYQIKDNVDFRLFVNDLAEDSWYGDGAHFKQTGDFEIAAREGLIDEEGWVGEPFAGSYDGDGHTISGLYYIGTKSNMGLFTELLYNAEVKNLTINVKRFDTPGTAGAENRQKSNARQRRVCGGWIYRSRSDFYRREWHPDQKSEHSTPIR